jgi:hypothetical protein
VAHFSLLVVSLTRAWFDVDSDLGTLLCALLLSCSTVCVGVARIFRTGGVKDWLVYGCFKGFVCAVAVATTVLVDGVHT